MDTKNSSFLFRFLFDMFWLFFGLLPSVSSLLFDLSPQCLLVYCTIVKQFGDFASLTLLSPLFRDQTF